MDFFGGEADVALAVIYLLKWDLFSSVSFYRMRGASWISAWVDMTHSVCALLTAPHISNEINFNIAKPQEINGL